MTTKLIYGEFMMEDFYVEGPLGPIECIVEHNQSENNAVLIMSHGFRGSRESSGYAKGTAVAASSYCDVVRYNFTGTQKLSLQVAELGAVVAKVRQLKPSCKLFLLGRSMGGAASMLYASQDDHIDGLILWSAPHNLAKALVNVMGEKAFQDLENGITLHFDDERGQCDITPDYLTDYYSLKLEEKYEHWNGRPILLLHCEGDEQVPVAQARYNIELLGSCCESHIFPNGSHSIGEYSKETGIVIQEWLKKQLQ